MVYDEQREAVLGERSMAQLVNDLSEQMSRLVRDEVTIATAEMKAKGKRLGLGAGLAGAAGMIALFGMGVLIATAVLALALVMPAWAAALIIGSALVLLAGLLALIGRTQLRKGSPPVPREAVDGMHKDFDTVKERMHR